MEKLIYFIEMQLNWAKQTPNTANAFFHNAFGGLQFYIIEHNLKNEDYAELEKLWNETYRPQFEELVYGGEA